MAFGKKEALPVLSIVFGLIILLKPDFLALLVGVYLIVAGITALVSK
ncbi:MAG TPA: DUF3096 domain-containing protein [archaeon]|nr:DUF3096 domain-containing protein [archaeon]